MKRGLRKIIGKHLKNIPGWRTNRKIIVFESDDWGAVRMSSKDNLKRLSSSGINTQNCHYVQYDALASEEDLQKLFDLLISYKGLHGRHPIITANVIMANPDFERIKAADFREYHYEKFVETLNRYPNHKNSFNIWEQGIQEGLFHPQFHGREHLQVMRWMSFLQNPKSDTRKAFDLGIFGLSKSVTLERRKSFMASYDWSDSISRNFILDSVPEGLSMFSELFGFNSLSSIAPNYTWHEDIEQVLSKHGVRYIQGGTVQKSPVIGEKYKKKRHYVGQTNEYGQKYLVRNCKFEPSSNPDIDWVDYCFKNIETAFFWKKPAIIEMHRVNFIGFINAENRDRNLKRFKQLLKKIIKKWPEVEFLTSDQLGQIIEKDE